MSEQPQKEDRTERPSEKRLRDAREKGQVPRSRELANVAVLGCAVLALKATGGHVGASSRDWMRQALTIDPDLLGAPERMLAHSVGLARCYSAGSVAELLRSLLRGALFGGVGGWVVWRAFAALLGLPQASLEASVAGGVDLVLGALLAMIGSLLLLAAIDVPWQHYQHRAKLKMTKQEVRDEHKQLEGNPEIKARVRQVARQLSQRRMMEAVPGADVVVMNPTHYAVALKYQPGMRAPKVVAKGVDELALAIRGVAEKHRVAIVEAPPLARALYRMAQVDQEIPVKLYAAVAQVLSYVYQLRTWVPGRGPMPALADMDVGADGVPDPVDGAGPGGDGSPAR